MSQPDGRQRWRVEGPRRIPIAPGTLAGIEHRLTSDTVRPADMTPAERDFLARRVSAFLGSLFANVAEDDNEPPVRRVALAPAEFRRLKMAWQTSAWLPAQFTGTARRLAGERARDWFKHTFTLHPDSGASPKSR